MSSNRFQVTVAGQVFDATVHDEHDGHAEYHGGAEVTRVTVDGEDYEVVALHDGAAIVRVHGSTVQTTVQLDGNDRPRSATAGSVPFSVEVRTARQVAFAASQALAGRTGAQSNVHAPMPGRIVRVLVAVGDVVELGAPVILMEAMKMENELRAATAGIVQAVCVAIGDTVESQQLLCEITAQDATP